MKTLLICHEEDALDREGLARWLASFSNPVGVVVIREEGGRMRQRVKREIKRVGWWRFADVLAFRLYYKFAVAAQDAAWRASKLTDLRRRFPEAENVPHLVTHSPNSAEAEAFIKNNPPDIVLARCKTILKESVFSVARTGTFVMHPGICPEYRNAHGCFWAFANDDLTRVGMTLLKIDKGVDTGAVYGFYTCAFDEINESHNVVQARVVFDNLDELKDKLIEINDGAAHTIDTRGRKSATWGQPWLTSYLRWKRRARARQTNNANAVKGESAS